MACRMYLKLGDIKGSSKDADHEKWIEIDSFGYAVSNSVNAVAKAKDKPGGEACVHSDIAIDKTIDNVSTQLLAYCSVGRAFPTAEIDVCEEEELLFKIKLKGVYVSSVSVGGSIGGIPSESIVLAYAKIAWQYRNQAAQNWDLVENKGSMKKKG